jgi:hypothetical protein
MFMTLNQAGNSGIQNSLRTNETVVMNFPACVTLVFSPELNPQNTDKKCYLVMPNVLVVGLKPHAS